eukprot:696537-Pelagomonas_calceolata.AAC.2
MQSPSQSSAKLLNKIVLACYSRDLFPTHSQCFADLAALVALLLNPALDAGVMRISLCSRAAAHGKR